MPLAFLLLALALEKEQYRILSRSKNGMTVPKSRRKFSSFSLKLLYPLVLEAICSTFSEH